MMNQRLVFVLSWLLLIWLLTISEFQSFHIFRHGYLSWRNDLSRSSKKIQWKQFTKNSNDDEETKPDNVQEQIMKWFQFHFSWKSSLVGFFSGIILAGTIIVSPIMQYVDIQNLPMSRNLQTLETMKNENPLVEPSVLFQSILLQLQNQYFDEIDPKTLFKTGIKAMLQSLDPYTEFEDLQEAKQLEETVKGRYAGVGMVISDIAPLPSKEEDAKLPSHVQIVNAFEGYSFDQGIRPGDLILSVNNMDTSHLNSLQVKDLLRGEPDSLITIKLLRDYSIQHPSSKSGTIVERQFPRSFVQTSDVRLATLLGNLETEDGIGYIRLSGFNQGAGRDFRHALYLLRMNSLHDLKGLILDLRDNPGGLLASAIDIASDLLPMGSEIVTAKDRNGQEIIYSSATPSLLPPDTKVVVLVNRGTASAAEILAGAIQDYDAGLILGNSPTFGKGLIQKVIPLPFQTALKATIAKYYTPSGRCIQEMRYTGGRASSSSSSASEASIIRKDNTALKEVEKDDPIYDSVPVYSEEKPRSLAETSSPIPESERQIFYTKHSHRPVRDGRGIEPDLILPLLFSTFSPTTTTSDSDNKIAAVFPWIESFLWKENVFEDFLSQSLSSPKTLREEFQQAAKKEKDEQIAVLQYYQQQFLAAIDQASPLKLKKEIEDSRLTAIISKETEKERDRLESFHHEGKYSAESLLHFPSLEQFYVLNHHSPSLSSSRNLMKSRLNTPIDAQFFYHQALSNHRDFQTFQQTIVKDFQSYLHQRLYSPSTSTEKMVPLSVLGLFPTDFFSLPSFLQSFPVLSSLKTQMIEKEVIPLLQHLIEEEISHHSEEIFRDLQLLLFQQEFPMRLINYYQIQEDPQIAMAMELLQPSDIGDKERGRMVPVRELSRSGGRKYYKVPVDYLQRLGTNSKAEKELPSRFSGEEFVWKSYDTLLQQILPMVDALPSLPTTVSASLVSPTR